MKALVEARFWSSTLTARTVVSVIQLALGIELKGLHEYTALKMYQNSNTKSNKSHNFPSIQ